MFQEPAPPPPDEDTHDDEAPDEVRQKLNTERRHRREFERKSAELQKTVDAQAKRLKQFEDRDKTEAQRNAEALEASKAETAEAKRQLGEVLLELLRRQVAEEKDLPRWASSRLKGNNRDEIGADADRLKAELDGAAPKPRRPQPDPRLGHTGNGPVTTTTDQFAAAMRKIL